MSKHIERLLAFLRQNDVAGIFIKGEASIRYFSGFTGADSMLFVDDVHRFIITDSRYFLQAQEEAPEWQLVDRIAGLQQRAGELSVSGRVAIDGMSMTCAEHQRLAFALPSLAWRSLDITKLRQIKTDEELTFIKKAVEISDNAFALLLPELHAGMKEYEAAALLECHMRMLGSEKNAFETIVASGERSALPHGIASDKVINNGDLVTFDFGAVYNGYCSDITRTIVMGKATEWQKELYDIVLRANLIGESAVCAGVKGCEVDAEVREFISYNGYGAYFGHGLGHGVGLEIHEEPFLSKRGITVLQPGMVVTVEPGIYLPQQGGVRIEDTVVVTAAGCEKLTSVGKNLMEIC